MNLRGKIGGVLAALGLAAGLSLAGAGTAVADVMPPPSGQWAEIFNPYLHAQGITLCVDDPSGSMTNGQQLQLWRCHGYASNGAPQRWVIVPAEAWHMAYDGSGNTVFGPLQDTLTGGAAYVVVNEASGLCLTAQAYQPAASVIQAPCNAVPFTKDVWELHTVNGPDGPDFQLYALWASGSSPSCVSASNFTDSNGTRLVMEACDRYDTSQLWNLG
jgi:hypothetical protein